MNIVLLGYMGSGKTSVGKVLAQHLEYKFLDLDQCIETEEQKAIPELFEAYGEVYFRKKETFYLQQLLEIDSNLIISLGGGTPCFGSNMEVIKEKEHNLSIYLETSYKELANRLYDEREGRPLIAHTTSIAGLEEFIAKHLFERRFYYHQAHHKVQTDGKNMKVISREIEGLL